MSPQPSSLLQTALSEVPLAHSLVSGFPLSSLSRRHLSHALCLLRLGWHGVKTGGRDILSLLVFPLLPPLPPRPCLEHARP